VLTVLAVLLFALIELAERVTIPWHVSQRSR
jgi:ABC-type nitrate/sulfonate/bicarbonate transport system permease component